MEMTVVTKAKDLCGYVLTITEKSPKRFRFTITSRMQNLALDTIERIYRGNDAWEQKDRLKFQHEALTAVKILGYIALLGREQGAILPKQYEQITKNIHDVQNLIGAWIKSDRKRFEGVG